MPGRQYWEEFELPLRPGENVISALMAIQKHPVNRAGERVTPVAWEQGCLEEVCGSCSMLVNGHPRQACTALIHDLIADTKQTSVVLAPFSKFPLVRDLVVDRSSMFENLKKMRAWIEAANSQEQGDGPLIPPQQQELLYSLSQCMTCGCCLEACPQINARSTFIGAAAISQARLFNTHPTGAAQRQERLRDMMQPWGVKGCGNAQNCVEVCPKDIPLTESIAEVGREVTVQALKDVFNFYNRRE